MNDDLVHFEVEEVDILLGPGHDLSQSSNRKKWLQRIEQGEYEVVLCTPPRSTFTRVRMANLRGPPPVRSLQFPRGFPWLCERLLDEAELGNVLVDFTTDVYKAALVCITEGLLPFVYLFSEHPEDLGRVYREEDRAPLDPAAIWQLKDMRTLLEMKELGLFTLAFGQCCFGAAYRKPTRTMSNIEGLRTWGNEGWPVFGPDREYLGPLQACKCRITMTLAKGSNQEGFRTTSTSSYPPQMDLELAQAIYACLTSSSPSKVGHSGQGREDCGDSQTTAGRSSNPMDCGGGEITSTEVQNNRESTEKADTSVGQAQNTEAAGRRPRHGSEFQEASSHGSSVLGDEDHEFLIGMAKEGVSLGVDETMPRTPKVFEEKVKWARELVETQMEEIWADNYESAESSSVADRRIRVRDRMRLPLVDDAAAVLVEAKRVAEERKTEERCAVVYDVKRAHKLLPVLERDWGLQAFRLPGERKSDGVYVHTGDIRGRFSSLLLAASGGDHDSGKPSA
eukprot:s652_g6.t1